MKGVRTHEPALLLAWVDGPFWDDFDQHVFASLGEVQRSLRSVYGLEGDEALSAWLGVCDVNRARRRRRRMLALSM